MFVWIVLMAAGHIKEKLNVGIEQIKFQFCQHLTGNYEFYSSSSIRLRNDVVDGKICPLNVLAS